MVPHNRGRPAASLGRAGQPAGAPDPGRGDRHEPGRPRCRRVAVPGGAARPAPGPAARCNGPGHAEVGMVGEVAGTSPASVRRPAAPAQARGRPSRLAARKHRQTRATARRPAADAPGMVTATTACAVGAASCRLPGGAASVSSCPRPDLRAGNWTSSPNRGCDWHRQRWAEVPSRQSAEVSCRTCVVRSNGRARGPIAAARHPDHRSRTPRRARH